MTDDLVTGAEFGRWRSDFAAFQDRLEVRLNEGFGTINERLDAINGRGRSNSERIAALGERVDTIAAKGCGKLEAHQALVDGTGTGRRWHEHPAARVGAGGVGIGAGFAAAVELLKTIGGLFAGK